MYHIIVLLFGLDKHFFMTYCFVMELNRSAKRRVMKKNIRIISVEQSAKRELAFERKLVSKKLTLARKVRRSEIERFGARV
jgi:hypothetical protein